MTMPTGGDMPEENIDVGIGPLRLYTDRASQLHAQGGDGPHHRAWRRQPGLKVLGIRQLLAWSPQARGRSERAWSR